MYGAPQELVIYILVPPEKVSVKLDPFSRRMGEPIVIRGQASSRSRGSPSLLKLLRIDVWG